MSSTVWLKMQSKVNRYRHNNSDEGELGRSDSESGITSDSDEVMIMILLL